MGRSFTERMIGAATLDVSVYEEVEHDRDATAQAAAVVAIAAVAAAIGSYHAGGGAVIGAVISAIVGWYVWAFITLVIGTWFFEGTADMGEMLRTLGFAQAPGVLFVVGVIPLLGALAGLVVHIWMLVCGVVAIRQALDFTTGKAVGTVLIGWAVKVAIGIALAILMGGAALISNIFGSIF